MSVACRVVSVALPLPIRKRFSYSVPADLALPTAGTRVRVPFAERVLTGVVMGEPGVEDRRLRDVIEVLDREPVCPPDLLAAVERVAYRFFASTGEVLKSALPARLPRAGAARYQLTEQGARAHAGGAERDILDRLAGGQTASAGELSEGRQKALRNLEEKGWIRVAVPAAKRPRSRDCLYAAAPLDGPERERRLSRSPRGRQVLAYLDRVGRRATASEVRDATGAGPGVVKSLLSRGLVTSSPRPDTPEGHRAAQAPARVRVLTSEQRIAWEVLREAIARRRYFPALLNGVTGSGKTEVYLQAIAATLNAGRGAIWLVPEIALTPVFARELTRQFGERAAVLHSALSERERGQAWDRARSGRVKVVIGPRSAAFAPVADLGLLLVDEEHDSSYKQRESPRYDAREVAAVRARASRAVLLFGSATPSMEAYWAARQGRVASLRLTERVDGKPLPAVQVVDLKHEPARPEEKGVALFSRGLTQRLREVFARGEQAILLQPRRGFAPILLCRDCGFDFHCDRCSVSRTVHARGSTLVCHYCGDRRPVPPRCPDCGGGLLEAVGAGTERVADRFAETFPGVTFGVLDRDTARRRGIASLLDDMQSGRIACLIGTQMVAKGHDFENVTAVGVLSADTILNFPDFRAGEKTFQLVAQVAGRAGRGDKPGTVHVQTFHPSHPAITRAAAHDVEGFARDELEFRRVFFYPPYCELAQILTSSADRQRAELEARHIADRLRQTASSVRISGPAPAPLERLQGLWRYQILLRASSRSQILEALEASIPERLPGGVQLATDVDPQDLM